jgi:hypothetical protein
MTKEEILQNLSIEFSKLIKNYLSNLKMLDKKDKRELNNAINDFKSKIDTLTEQYTEIRLINKSLIREIIKQEYNKINESKKIPKKDTPEYHEHKIAISVVKNPTEGLFLGGLSEKDAIKTLQKKFGYSDEDIERLKK